jgi:hypothetical protein
MVIASAAFDLSARLRKDYFEPAYKKDNIVINDSHNQLCSDNHYRK